MYISQNQPPDTSNPANNDDRPRIYFNDQVTLRINPPFPAFDHSGSTMTITSEHIQFHTHDTTLIITFPEIILHAITSSPASIYCQLSSDDITTELFITPNTKSVNDLYDALCTCIALHPDPETTTPNTSEIMNGTGWITADNIDQFEDAEESNERKYRRLE